LHAEGIRKDKTTDIRHFFDNQTSQQENLPTIFYKNFLLKENSYRILSTSLEV
jgi:hypothetical protein